MRAYSNMPTNEFVAQLRDIAIKAGARALVLDQIDRIVEGPSEDEIAEQINKADAEGYDRGYKNGLGEGEQNKENAAEDAAKEMHADCTKAIEAKGAEIGLTEEQIYKVVNHILWDCRP